MRSGVPGFAGDGSGFFAVRSGHQQAQSLARCPVARHDVHDLALVHHRNAVGQGHDLVEFGADQQHGGALVPFGDDLLVDELDRADVDAARRLCRDQQLDRPAELARHDHLLLVAAGEVGRVHRDVGRAHVVTLHQVLGMAADSLLVDGQAVGKGRLEIGVQHQVMRHAVGVDHAVGVPVFRHMAALAVLRHATRVGIGHVQAVDGDAAAIERAQAGQHFDQLALPVALDAGYADDLAGARLQRNVA